MSCEPASRDPAPILAPVHRRRAPAILLTGAGKRYDIVACFAQLTKTIVADPNPLAPAQYAAHVRAAVPLIEDPEYVPALQRLCAEHGVGARAAADRPRHRDARRGPRRRAAARARALARGRPRDLRQVRGAPAAHAAGPALAAHGPARGRPRRARVPGHGQASPGLGGALDPPRKRPRPGTVLPRLRVRADDGPARDGRPGALDRLSRRSRRALPERDPAHDARVAGRRVDQGAGRPRGGADRARQAHDGGACAYAVRRRSRSFATPTSVSGSPM